MVPITTIRIAIADITTPLQSRKPPRIPPLSRTGYGTAYLTLKKKGGNGLRREGMKKKNIFNAVKKNTYLYKSITPRTC